MPTWRLEPLRVTAQLKEPLTLNVGTVALDALLMAQVARELGLPPLIRGKPPDESPGLPLQKHERGFYMTSWALCSEAIWNWQTHVHKPTPVDAYMRLCSDKLKTIDATSGPEKAYRLPRYRRRIKTLMWYCVGDADEIERLLRGVTRIGSCRRDGIGKVRSWSVEKETNTWYGFPVLADGKPLRSLPDDLEGLSKVHRTGWASWRLPSWEPLYQELCAIP